MFGGFATKLYLNKVDNETTNVREAIYDNYRIVADIPESFVEKEIKYSIKIYNSGTNTLTKNNDVLLTIRKRYESKVRHPSSRYRYREIKELTPELNGNEGSEVNTFLYKYDEKGTYQLNFTINSIGGEQLNNPIIVTTNHEVF